MLTFSFAASIINLLYIYSFHGVGMISKLIKVKDPRRKQIAVFIVKAVLLYIIWFICYDFLISQDGSINIWLNHRVATDASYLLDLFGYNGGTVPGIHQTVLCIGNKSIVGVGNPCNGLELFALFAGFIICFPGNSKKKLWFIPVGIIIIHIANVLRTFALALIQLKAPQYLEFNHHYTFTVIVYSIIFLLWMYWVNHYSDINLKSEKA